MTKYIKNKKSKVLFLIFILFVFIVIFVSKNLVTFSVNENKSDNTVQNILNDITDELDEEDKNNYETSVSLLMVGDALIHNGVYNDAFVDGIYDFNYLFDELTPILANYDLKYYNQETILGGTELGLSNYPRFNSPQEVGDAFINAGFNLVSLATNHSLDKGESGLLNSLEYWKRQENIISAGSYESEEARTTPQIMEKNGISYTLLSYSTLTNGLSIPEGKDYLFNLYSDEKVKEDIERIRNQVDVIMVAMHWGSEYTHVPTKEETRIAEYLASLGVNIVIGTHPHVIQPIDFINETMVVYSLGNFVSGQTGIEKLVGLMASVTIKKTVVEGVNSITLENPSAELVYTKKSNGRQKKQFKLYPFSKLNDSILPDYKKYYEYFMNIAANGTREITKIF